MVYDVCIYVYVYVDIFIYICIYVYVYVCRQENTIGVCDHLIILSCCSAAINSGAVA